MHPGTDVCVGHAERIDEARALGPDVDRGHRAEPHRVLQQDAVAWCEVIGRRRRVDDHLDLVGRDACRGDRPLGGELAEADAGVAGADPVTLLDAGALL
jgi:hypothetical protein